MDFIATSKMTDYLLTPNHLLKIEFIVLRFLTTALEINVNHIVQLNLVNIIPKPHGKAILKCEQFILYQNAPKDLYGGENLNQTTLGQTAR